MDSFNSCRPGRKKLVKNIAYFIEMWDCLWNRFKDSLLVILR
ncbi:hypothetical protein B4098_1465 [Heyndrickxia coagulans]|uniref:Uncharacterized protein n=1 Tax=Heyndrickxia coagulans TaxID=1398 RepID=A0A150KAG4_HEYCO|nr:hypothetical protein B4098_1465 [Heyndrickxia coagulans]